MIHSPLPVLLPASIALCLAATVADAARLTLIERKEVRWEHGVPGPRGEDPGRVVAPVTGSGDTTIEQDFEDTEPLKGEQRDESFNNFLIEPEVGEAVGDCVIVDWTYFAATTLEVTGDADARVGVGGGTVTVDSDPLVVAFAQPAQIVLNPAAEAAVQFSYGPDVRGPGDGDVGVDTAGEFAAKIGDTVQLLISSGNARHVPAGGSAKGTTDHQVSAAVRPEVVACSVLEIPTLDGRALGLLILVLAGAGLLLVRRPA